MINKRSIVKTSYQPGTTGGLAEWTARYASITFSLLGYQFPWAGMNERGLSFSTMALTETECSQPDERPLLESGFWLQYMLDINTDLTGDVTGPSTDLDFEANRDLVEAYIVRWAIDYNPDDITALIGLFESYPCAQTRRSPGRRIAPTR